MRRVRIIVRSVLWWGKSGSNHVCSFTIINATEPVPEHLKKDYSTKYKKYMVFAIKQFTEVLTDKGISINKTPISELSDIHVISFIYNRTLLRGQL